MDRTGGYVSLEKRNLLINPVIEHRKPKKNTTTKKAKNENGEVTIEMHSKI